MQTSNRLRALIIATGLAAAASFAQADSVMKATDWLGHVVTTRDGKELGTVRDFGIDEHSGKVVFVVVSVGSFLIENNLIAVAPDALVRTRGEHGVLLLDTDMSNLKDAKRFASDSKWPATPDVLRSATASTVPAPPPAGANEPTAATTLPTGTATIESRSKTAHLSASERYVKETEPPAQVMPAASEPASPNAAAKPTAKLEPITKFDQLDKDGDGVLNRSEFAPVMTRTDSYSKIDTNADGVIERQEFDAYQSAHGATD
jgi:sporulation protein YlmC with PRC-barrel domain